MIDNLKLDYHQNISRCVILRNTDDDLNHIKNDEYGLGKSVPKSIVNLIKQNFFLDFPSKAKSQYKLMHYGI